MKKLLCAWAALTMCVVGFAQNTEALLRLLRFAVGNEHAIGFS